MTVADELRAHIVVDREEVAAPVHGDGRRRMQADAERRAQRATASFRAGRAEVRPVAFPNQYRDFPIAQPVRRFVFSPCVHGSRSGSGIVVQYRLEVQIVRGEPGRRFERRQMMNGQLLVAQRDEAGTPQFHQSPVDMNGRQRKGICNFRLRKGELARVLLHQSHRPQAQEHLAQKMGRAEKAVRWPTLMSHSREMA